MESFWAHTTEPDFPAMQADIATFLDTSALQWTLADAPNVVIDRRHRR